MPQTGHFDKVLAHAEASLTPLRREAKTPADLLQVYRRFLKKENHRIKLQHRQGAGGVDLARRRAALLDVVINDLFASALERRGLDPMGGASKKGASGHPVTLVANGGYGRALLNPGSDIDLLFLLPEKAKGVSEEVGEIITQILMMLYDTGFKVGHSVRTVAEAIQFANRDHPTKTALLDARFIAGDRAHFDTFAEKFHKGCLKGQEREYLNVRSKDIRDRHQKWGQTIHLQEPNVKEGCGGLRDYHNLIWVLWVLRQSRDLRALVTDGRLTLTAYKEIENAHEFLMRVRNGLHYAQKGKSGDIMTLRHQGILATAFSYPQPTILRRSEAFMRDYYFHTRNLYHHSTSIMQGFELEVVGDNAAPAPFIGFLARRKAKEEHFDGFFSRESLIYPETMEIFAEDPNRMMRTFLHAQQRHLKFSPEIRKLFKSSYSLISKDFRKLKANRETFEQILQQRGEVARVLRLMHRVGFLGRYLPEFGALTDLVQHEFFHRYSADEHTLRCIDQLDTLATTEDPKVAFFQHLLRDVEDPYILYLALILHDTGRAENMRHHEDASAMLASQVCTRLRIEGERRRRLTFLVDHHLTFWRVATTRNIDDPATVAEFAQSMQNQFYLETLFLFTYVDSRGTNEEAWSDWKYSLMSHLYRNTLEWFEDRQAFSDKANQPRTAQKEKVTDKMAADFGVEIEAHFEKMPERYFRFRGHESIVRHLRLFRKFFEKFARPGTEPLIPVVGWEARPAEGFSLVEVVGWNRHHFLAKVAGALAARNLNILSADLFTREDDLVLDIFRVCTTNFGPVKSDREMERVEKMLATEFGIGDHEVDFQDLIGRVRSPSPFQNALEIEIPQQVWISNDLSEDHTVLELQAQDRIGLLYDIFTALGNLDAEVVHARISTQAGAAIDRFYLADTRTAKKIADKARLAEIELAISKVVGL